MANRSYTDLEKTVAIRVTKDVFGKIEKFQKKLAAKTPGVKINQSDAVRVLLERAIAAEGL